jgi:hypothetical protein
LQKLDQLGRAAPECLGRRPHVQFVLLDDIEGFSQQSGEVLVMTTDGDPVSLSARPPPLSGNCGATSRQADFESQPDAKPPEGNTAVFRLASSFTRLAANTSRIVLDDHRCFYLVAVLAAGTGPPRPGYLALGH